MTQRIEDQLCCAIKIRAEHYPYAHNGDKQSFKKTECGIEMVFDHNGAPYCGYPQHVRGVLHLYGLTTTSHQGVFSTVIVIA